MKSSQQNLRLLATVLIAAVAACDVNVSNPGPVEDSFIDNPDGLEALVNGAGRALSTAMGTSESSLGFSGAAASRELHPGGQTGSYGVTVLLSRQFIDEDDQGSQVDGGQRARWLAEEAVRRIRDSESVTISEFEPAALGLLYTGYINRLLGEHVCETVIDGGPAMDFMVHFDRAEEAFTEAISIAQAIGNTTYVQAAYGGRASVRAWMGNWSGVVADAAMVPRAFKFQAMYNALDRDQTNSFYFSGTTGSFRTVTYWHTYAAQNYDELGDPRTKYNTYPDYPNVTGSQWDLGDGRGELGDIPWYQQGKYTSEASPIDLTDGLEAALLMAEAELRDGDWQAAMSMINDIRSDVGVAARTATSAEEAWTWLKLEVFAELWLEDRWLGQRRRWLGDGADGPASGPLPALLSMVDRPGSDRCFPISRAERETNSNLGT